MTGLHATVGTLVIVGYVITLILNARTARSGAEFAWQKIVSFGAATLLLFQIMLGFSLLADNDIPAFHYLIALAAIIPVGMEHGYGSQRKTAMDRGKIGALANVFTLVLVLVAYMIGETAN